MKTVKIESLLIFLAMVCLALGIAGCNRSPKQPVDPLDEDVATQVVLKDYGPAPTVLNIDEYTTANDNYRTSLWTGENLQVTLMAIPVGGEVGLEQHTEIDQFLRIEEGEGQVMMGDTKEGLDFIETAGPDFMIVVPAGKWHNIVNTGSEPFKLYTIYAPTEHPHGTVHKTYEEALEAEHLH